MSYNSENRPRGNPAPGQRDGRAPDPEATGVFDRSQFAARQSQPSSGSRGFRPPVLSPRGVSRRTGPSKKLSPLEIYAMLALGLALILGIALIVVLASRGGGGSGPASPAPTQAQAVIPTQPPIAYQTPPTATVIVTPPPSGAPVTIQTPAPTQAPAPTRTPAPTPSPAQLVTPEPGRSYSRESVLAEARAAAERDSHYSTVSEKDVELEVPADSAFLRTPFVKKAYAGDTGRAIYIMPRPVPGNGVLGTVPHGQQVTILAENAYYYFFVTQDGRAGWNGKSFFSDP